MRILRRAGRLTAEATLEPGTNHQSRTRLRLQEFSLHRPTGGVPGAQQILSRAVLIASLALPGSRGPAFPSAFARNGQIADIWYSSYASAE